MIYGVATLAACMLLGTLVGTVFGELIATFYSGFGCLLCPSLLYGITQLFFAVT